VAAAAAAATLQVIEEEPVIETINQRGRALMAGIGQILTDAGIPHAVIGPPSMFGVVLGENAGDVHDFRTYLETDTDLYEAIGMELSQRGVQPDADGREPWFLCYALSDEDVAETLTVFEASVKAVKRKG
jgi:glutamate-1-semialdehyde 2,1-aminomutase